MSKLYVVGTPIGNLSDMSPRALKVLEEADFIAAEDTRVTLKLLTHFGIHNTLVSYHEHNLRERGEYICERILAGESCAIVTDAGMPCISDPGEDLVHLCAEKGIEINVVPSPTAAMSALAVSGLSTSRFFFEGFLSVSKKQRAEHLEEIKDIGTTLIFYEAPHKLKTTLDDLLYYLGDRKAALCRELTKIHEETVRATPSELIEIYKDKSPKGEYVIVVEGCKKENKEDITVRADDNIVTEETKKLIEEGMKLSSACKITAKKYGLQKSEVYRIMTENI